LGYGKLFNKHYCGIEGMFHQARHRIKSSISSQRWNLNTYDELNVRVRDIDLSLHYRQGYAITDTFMIFGKVGFSRNKIKAHLISNSVMKYPDASINFPGYLAKHKVVYPVKLAIEFEKKCWTNIALTFAYTYERHGSIKLKGSQTIVTEGGAIKQMNNHKVTMQSSAIIFGIKLYW
jgi:hypothetical protein